MSLLLLSVPSNHVMYFGLHLLLKLDLSGFTHLLVTSCSVIALRAQVNRGFGCKKIKKGVGAPTCALSPPLATTDGIVFFSMFFPVKERVSDGESV